MADSINRLGGARSALGVKAPVRVKTTANIPLTGWQTIDGITPAAGDANLRILVANQTDTTENGIYVMDGSDWARAVDFDGNTDFTQGTLIYVTQGSGNGGLLFYVSDATPPSVGVNAISFSPILPGLPAVTTDNAIARYNGTSGALQNSPFTTINDVGFLALTASGANIEIGARGSANTPFIDFHSGATDVDFDTRLIASGGDGTLGGGTLSFAGAGLAPTSNNATMLGTASLGWADVFIASGGALTFGSNNMVVQHTAGVIFVSSATTSPIYAFSGSGQPSLRIHNSDATATVNKLSSLHFFGTDTISANKEVGAIRSTSVDANWVNSVMDFYTRKADTETLAFRIDQNQGVRLTSATGGLGYATGAGGAVTQATSKVTGVTLNTICGRITTASNSLAAGVITSFTLTNSAIEANDLLNLQQVGGTTPGAYTFASVASAGSAQIYLRNATASSLGEAVVIGFSITRSAIS